jgi:hypothetical protein
MNFHGILMRKLHNNESTLTFCPIQGIIIDNWCEFYRKSDA